MNKEELLGLREQIVEQTKKLALESDADSNSRFEVLINLVRAGDASMDIVQKTYEVAQTLDDDSAKLDAYLEIIYAIDGQLSNDDSEQAVASQGVDSSATETAE